MTDDTIEAIISFLSWMDHDAWPGLEEPAGHGVRIHAGTSAAVPKKGYT
jgi:hypothetical protein